MASKVAGTDPPMIVPATRKPPVIEEVVVTTPPTAPALRTIPPAIGDRARRSRAITTSDIELFTSMTGDRNPVHYDLEVARASRFGEIIVQGGVTSGLLNAVVAEQLPGPGSVFLETRWSYRAPVRPGDEITAEVEVTGARSDKPITSLRTTITNQSGVVVLDGEAVVWRDPVVAALVPTHPAPGSGTGR
jgi:acyl dehydratase